MNYPPSVYSHCCISIFLPAQALFLHSSFTLLLRCFELKCKTFVLGDHCQGMLVLMTVFCVLTINLPIITGKGAYINYIKTLMAHKKNLFRPDLHINFNTKQQYKVGNKICIQSFDATKHIIFFFSHSSSALRE